MIKMNKGKETTTERIELFNKESIRILEEKENYKYLEMSVANNFLRISGKWE